MPRYSIPVFCLLAACGGGGGSGGGGSDGTPVVEPPPQIAASLGPAAAALLTDHANPVTYADPADVPTSGSARYEGYAYGVLSNSSDAITDNLIGALTLTTDFGSDSFSGRIDTLRNTDDQPLTGQLSVSGGTFDRAGNPNSDSTLQVSLSGTVTDTGNRSLEIGAVLEGDFLGNGAEAVGGELLGTVTHNGTTQNIDGGFIAAR